MELVEKKYAQTKLMNLMNQKSLPVLINIKIEVPAYSLT